MDRLVIMASLVVLDYRVSRAKQATLAILERRENLDCQAPQDSTVTLVSQVLLDLKGQARGHYLVKYQMMHLLLKFSAIPGENGDPGYSGSDGMPGLPGSRGDRGMDGLPGVPGLPGQPGEPGWPGPVGEKGIVGMDGKRGMKSTASLLPSNTHSVV